MDVCTLLKQQANNILMSTRRGSLESIPIVSTLRMNVCTLLKQQAVMEVVVENQTKVSWSTKDNISGWLSSANA
jgi:hypothetical protein